MPNVKRRFADDDPSSGSSDSDDEEAPQVVYRSGGKALRMPGSGKGMGKQLRPPGHDDSDEDDSDDEEEEEPVAPRPRGGKQLRMGKQLRAPPPAADEDDSDDDDDDDDEPVRPVPRSGGKMLSRMKAPSDEEDEEEAPMAPRVSGGKSLSRMQAPPEDDSEDDETVRPVARSGGKSLARMTPRGGGKQLRAPPVQEDEEEEQPKKVAASRGGGKSLMRMAAPPADDDDSDDDSEDDAPPPKKIVAARRGGGKQLRPAVDSEEEAPKKAKAAPARGGKQLRRPPPVEDSDDDAMDIDSEEEEEVVKAPARKAPARKTRKAAAKKAPEPASDAMDESDDSSDDEEAELDEMDTDKLVKDEEDQKYLDSLPEIEREAILADRFEKIKAEIDMKKALKQSKRKEKEAKATQKKAPTRKRKAATPAKKAASKKAKDDEALAKSLAGKRESSRNRDATGKKNQKAKALAALREERKRAAQKDGSESESDFGDDDDDSDDDYDEGGATLKPWQKKANQRKSSRLDQVESSEDEDGFDGAEDDDEDGAADRVVVEADLADYQKITLPRRRIGRWCNEPFFKEAVLNCYVKLFIGENEQGKRCYRLCQIVDVESTKSYQLPSVKGQKPVTTDKLLKLRFGTNEKLFPIALVSDVKALEVDVAQLVTQAKANRKAVVSKREAGKMRRRQDSLVNNYTYTREDIEANLRSRKKKGQATTNLGVEQTRAGIALQAAKAELGELRSRLKTTNDSTEIAEIEQAIAQAEQVYDDRLADEQIVLDKVKDRKTKLSNRRVDQKWAKVNKRAIQTNQKVDRGDLKTAEGEASKFGSTKAFNPYARRKVKPKILWEVGQKDDEQGEGAKDKEASKEGDEAREDGAPNLIQEHQDKASSLSQSHQFALDEEVTIQSSFLHGISGLGNKRVVKRVRKGLSIGEYQKRKAAGTL